MISFEGCHPEHTPLPSLLILQINVCSAEETVSFKVKGLYQSTETPVPRFLGHSEEFNLYRVLKVAF